MALLVGLHAGSAAAGAKEAKITSVEINGAAQVSRSEIKNLLALKSGEVFSFERLEQRSFDLLRKLQDRGYYFARVDSLVTAYSSDSSAVSIVVFLHEGEQARLAEYRIEGIGAHQNEVLRLLRLRVGRTFRPQQLERDIETIIDYFEDRGHPYCRVEVGTVDWRQATQEHDSGLLLSLRVQPGDSVNIDDIVILGNEHTKTATILRELPLRSGEIYRQQRVAQIQSRLMNLGFFKWVNPARLEQLPGGRNRLVLEVAEGNQNRFDGIVGYNPATANSSGFVSGLLDFSFGNLFGTGRQLAVRWERQTQETQELRFSYLEPWVGGWPLQASFHFEQLIQDTSYIDREVALGLGYRISESLNLTAGISRTDISPDSIGAIRFGIQPSSGVNLNVGISVGRIDNPLNPTHGILYKTSFELANNSSVATAGDTSAAAAFAAANQRRLSVDLESYFPLFRWQVLSFAFHGRQVKSDAPVVPIPNQYRFGGTMSLRGYREQEFRGDRIAWTNIEYRYLLGPRSRMFLFLDTGYFSQRDLSVDGNIVSSEKLKFGFGFGMRVDTRLGMVGVAYGLGQDDKFSNGKIHIGLTNEF